MGPLGNGDAVAAVYHQLTEEEPVEVFVLSADQLAEFDELAAALREDFDGMFADACRALVVGLLVGAGAVTVARWLRRMI